jgi:GNAT superfamily N-acetyltransferase
VTGRREDARVIGELLKGQYPDACTRTAPFAFWKMRALIRDAQAYALPDFDCHYMVRDGHLLYYSAPDGKCHLSVDELNPLNAISLPMEVFDQVRDKLRGFDVREGWILRYDFSDAPPARDFARWEAVDFDFSDAALYEAAARIIDPDGGWMTASGVRHMTAFSAFDPSLWFFVRDRSDGALAAVSISAYSPEVRETDLDWIFVRPDRQGKGAGRFLIGETVKRCAGKSDLIRVGGTEEFYRHCGFFNDVRWVWATKPGYDFRCPEIQP